MTTSHYSINIKTLPILTKVTIAKKNFSTSLCSKKTESSVNIIAFKVMFRKYTGLCETLWGISCTDRIHRLPVHRIEDLLLDGTELAKASPHILKNETRRKSATVASYQGYLEHPRCSLLSGSLALLPRLQVAPGVRHGELHLEQVPYRLRR